MNYPLATSTWGFEERNAAFAVLDSGLCTMGEKVKQFEKEFASIVGSRFAVMVNSGSSANLIMVAALFYTKNPRLKAGDEIIVPAVSWPTTYYPLHQYGLKLRFVDIDRNTLNYDLQKLEMAVGPNTRAIMVVNLLGNPNDFDQIQRIAKKSNLVVIEDNCESLGAIYGGKQAGTHGVMGTFSTFFSHHMSTMEGGVIVTDDEELYQVMVCLRAHGWTRNLPDNNLVNGKKSDDPFEESFKFVLPGYNVRPLEIEAAIGIEQLKKLPDFIKHRRSNAKVFMSLFDNDDRFLVQQEIGESSWFGFSLVIRPESGLTRKELSKKLLAAGIECRPVVAGNFTKNRVVSYFDHSIYGTLENAELIDSNGLFVGNHQYDISSEIRYLHTLI